MPADRWMVEREFRRKAGLCTRCGKCPAVGSRQFCEPCVRDEDWTRTNQAYVETFCNNKTGLKPGTVQIRRQIGEGPRSARIERMMELAMKTDLKSKLA